MAGVIGRIEQRLQRRAVQGAADLGVGVEPVQETSALIPHRHGVALHRRVGRLAR